MCDACISVRRDCPDESVRLTSYQANSKCFHGIFSIFQDNPFFCKKQFLFLLTNKIFRFFCHPRIFSLQNALKSLQLSDAAALYKKNRRQPALRSPASFLLTAVPSIFRCRKRRSVAGIFLFRRKNQFPDARVHLFSFCQRGAGNNIPIRYQRSAHRSCSPPCVPSPSGSYDNMHAASRQRHMPVVREHVVRP